MVKLNNVARSYKVVLLGGGGVGKSSLVKRFLGDAFKHDYQPTVQECYRQPITLQDGITGTIEIIDTAGQYEFPAMRALSVRTAEALVLVYSVTERQSFQEACRLYEELLEFKVLNEVPVLLVGNKCDHEQREVSWEESNEVAQSLMNCQCMETSAMDDVNVNSLFAHIYKALIAKNGKLLVNMSPIRPRSKTMPSSVLQANLAMMNSLSEKAGNKNTERGTRSNSIGVRAGSCNEPERRSSSNTSWSSLMVLREKFQSRRKRALSENSQSTNISSDPEDNFPVEDWNKNDGSKKAEQKHKKKLRNMDTAISAHSKVSTAKCTIL